MMAKYNILRDKDDLFENRENIEKKEIKDQGDEIIEVEPAHSPEPIEEAKNTPGDDFFSDEIFSAIEDEKPEPVAEAPVEQEELYLPEESISEPDIAVPSYAVEEAVETHEETAESEYSAPEEKSEKPILFSYDEDDKQLGINYKPIIIGVGIAAVLVVIFFIISNVFFGDDGGEELADQKVESAEERLQNEQEVRRQNFLTALNKSTSHNLKSIHLLATLGQKDIKYSSILLYGSSLDMEVFAKNREALANFNMVIKKNERIKEYKIETVDYRPGSNGGLFALYDINLNRIESAPSANSPGVVIKKPETWVQAIQQQSGLTINSQRSITSRQENLFNVNREEYELKGSLENCLALIDQFASSNQNITIHKLSFLPADQHKMSNSSYVLRLTLDFYL
jgi:hypothetical protein